MAKEGAREMTRRLGGYDRRGAAALASLSLALALACGGAVTGCSSGDTSNGSGDDGGGDVVTVDVVNTPDTGGGQDAGGPDTTVPDAHDSGPPDVVAEAEAAAPLPKLGSPTFSPDSGTNFTGPGSVQIIPPSNFPDAGNAFIYFTTNGTNPNTGSPVYSGPIQITQDTTIRAYASATGFQDSPIVAANYTVT